MPIEIKAILVVGWLLFNYVLFALAVYFMNLPSNGSLIVGVMITIILTALNSLALRTVVLPQIEKFKQRKQLKESK